MLKMKTIVLISISELLTGLNEGIYVKQLEKCLAKNKCYCWVGLLLFHEENIDYLITGVGHGYSYGKCKTGTFLTYKNTSHCLTETNFKWTQELYYTLKITKNKKY